MFNRFQRGPLMAPRTYQAGSTLPSSADITALLAATVAASKPNDLLIVLQLLNAKGVNPYDAVGTQVTITSTLP